MDMRQALERLCACTAPSGFEAPAAAVAAELLRPLVDEVSVDRMGNVLGVRRCGKEGAPRLLLDAHLDEIGLLVTGVEDGFLRFRSIGGVDPRMLPGRELVVLTDPPRRGIVTCPAGGEADKSIPLSELFVDVGLSQTEAERAVPVGTPMVYRGGCFALGEDQMCGKSMDDRSCFVTLLRAAELLRDRELDVDLYLLGSTREEVSGAGATVGTWAVQPDFCVAVDVTHGKTPDGPADKAFAIGRGPAIGVGPGNGPAYLEKTCDLPLAVKRILDSKTFDNGTICASEQSIICDDDMVPAVKAEMERQGAYFLDDEEREKLGRFILRANGTMNPEIVGRSVKTIANLAGLEKVPATARVLVAKETGVGRGHPYSNEKLGPILAFYTAENYEKVCEKVCEILHYEGAGHTFSMHTNDDKMVDYFARRVPASRVMVNTPSALGGIGGTTALQPALTLGCGAVGGSATSENVGPMHLLNLRYVAYGLKELDEIRASVPDCSDGVCRTAPSLENIDVDDIVRQIIGKLQKL